MESRPRPGQRRVPPRVPARRLNGTGWTGVPARDHPDHPPGHQADVRWRAVGDQAVNGATMCNGAALDVVERERWSP
jgi:hypothetical protein